jgi:hypothetical protein
LGLSLWALTVGRSEGHCHSVHQHTPSPLEAPHRHQMFSQPWGPHQPVQLHLKVTITVGHPRRNVHGPSHGNRDNNPKTCYLPSSKSAKCQASGDPTGCHHLLFSSQERHTLLS